MRLRQGGLNSSEIESGGRDIRDHVWLAHQLAIRETPRLWITHGVSGSGKTTLSEAVVQRHDAFRLRSDIERKRMFGLLPGERPSPSVDRPATDDVQR